MNDGHLISFRQRPRLLARDHVHVVRNNGVDHLRLDQVAVAAQVVRVDGQLLPKQLSGLRRAQDVPQLFDLVHFQAQDFMSLVLLRRLPALGLTRAVDIGAVKRFRSRVVLEIQRVRQLFHLHSHVRQLLHQQLLVIFHGYDRRHRVLDRLIRRVVARRTRAQPRVFGQQLRNQQRPVQ